MLLHRTKETQQIQVESPKDHRPDSVFDTQPREQRSSQDAAGSFPYGAGSPECPCSEIPPGTWSP